MSKLAATQLGPVTPENQMKWGVVEPLRGTFNWRGADDLVAFAAAHGQKVRGHTLVWHSQLPPWLIKGGYSKEEIKDLIVAHIATEAGRYNGKTTPETSSTSRSPTTGRGANRSGMRRWGRTMLRSR